MPRAVLDSSVLVSAFLNPTTGVASELLRLASRPPQEKLTSGHLRGAVFIYRPPGNQRPEDAAFETGAVERCVLRARAEALGVEDPRDFGINDDQVGRRARGEPADLEAEKLGGARGERAEEGEVVDVAGMDKT